MEKLMVIKDLTEAKSIYENMSLGAVNGSGGYSKAQFNQIAAYLANIQSYTPQKVEAFRTHCSFFVDALLLVEDKSKNKVAHKLDPYNVFATLVKTFDAGISLNPIKKHAGLGVFWSKDKNKYDLQVFVMYGYYIQRAAEAGYILRVLEVSDKDTFEFGEVGGKLAVRYKRNIDVAVTWDNLKGVLVAVLCVKTHKEVQTTFLNKAEIDFFRLKNEGSKIDNLNFFWRNNPIKMAQIKAIRKAVSFLLVDVADVENTYTFGKSGGIEQVEQEEVLETTNAPEALSPAQIFQNALQWDSEKFTPKSLPNLLFDARILALNAYQKYKSGVSATEAQAETETIKRLQKEFIDQYPESFPSGFVSEDFEAYRKLKETI